MPVTGALFIMMKMFYRLSDNFYFHSAHNWLIYSCTQIFPPVQPGSPGQGGGSSKYSRLPSTADSPHRWPSSSIRIMFNVDVSKSLFQGGFHCESWAAAGGDEEAGRDDGRDGRQHGQHQGHQPPHCQWTWRTSSVRLRHPWSIILKYAFSSTQNVGWVWGWNRARRFADGRHNEKSGKSTSPLRW